MKRETYSTWLISKRFPIACKESKDVQLFWIEGGKKSPFSLSTIDKNM